MKTDQNVRRGFTLVELLTVIAIVGILAAILIPTVGKARESARLTTCINRMRECGTALQLYANDHKNRLPDPEDAPGRRWPMFVAPYISSVTILTDASGRPIGTQGGNDNLLYSLPVLHDPVQTEVVGASGTFAYNVVLNKTYGANNAVNATGLSLAQFSRPSTFPVMTTSQADIGGGLQLEGNRGPSPMAVAAGYSGATFYRGPAPLFGRKAVFLFGDWHVTATDVCNRTAWPWNDPTAFQVK
jgi:prepilin-type N-terminal cleavage/methylation domain-containing protein